MGSPREARALAACDDDASEVQWRRSSAATRGWRLHACASRHPRACKRHHGLAHHVRGFVPVSLPRVIRLSDPVEELFPHQTLVVGRDQNELHDERPSGLVSRVVFAISRVVQQVEDGIPVLQEIPAPSSAAQGDSTFLRSAASCRRSSAGNCSGTNSSYKARSITAGACFHQIRGGKQPALARRGAQQVMVDGRVLDGETITLLDDGSSHRVLIQPRPEPGGAQ